MDTLFLAYIGVVVVGILLSILTTISKNNILLNISIISSAIFSSFVGAINYSILPSTYTKQRLLAIFCAMLVLLPTTLNIFKHDLINKKNEKLILSIIKISNTLVIFINLILLFFKVL